MMRIDNVELSVFLVRANLYFTIKIVVNLRVFSCIGYSEKKNFSKYTKMQSNQ